MNLLKCNTLRIYRQRFIMRTSTNNKSLRQDSTYTVSLKKFSNLLISSMTKRRSIFDWSPRRIIAISPDEICPKCHHKPLKQTALISRRYIIDLVSRKDGLKKTITQYAGTQGYCP